MQISTHIDIEYARIVLDRDLEPIERWHALQALGFDYSECDWHLDHPRQFMEQGYI